MFNAAHILETALIMLAAFLIGAVLGTLCKLALRALSRKPAAAPLPSLVVASEATGPALVTAPVIDPVVAPVIPVASKDVPVPDFAATMIALANAPIPEIRQMPAIAPLPPVEGAVAMAPAKSAIEPARAAGETTSGLHIASPLEGNKVETPASPDVTYSAEILPFPTEGAAPSLTDVAAELESLLTQAVAADAEAPKSPDMPAAHGGDASPIATEVALAPVDEVVPEAEVAQAPVDALVPATDAASPEVVTAGEPAAAVIDTVAEVESVSDKAEAAAGREPESAIEPEAATEPEAAIEPEPAAEAEAKPETAPEASVPQSPGPETAVDAPPEIEQVVLETSPVVLVDTPPQALAAIESVSPATPAMPAPPVEIVTTKRSAEEDEAAAMRAIEGNWSPRQKAGKPRRSAPAPDGVAEAGEAVKASAAAVTAAVEATNAVVEAMPDPNKPSGILAPRNGRPDELTNVIGILPIIETALNSLGIFHFDQLAGLTDKQVSWVETHLGIDGRIGREHWREQAVELAALTSPKVAAET